MTTIIIGILTLSIIAGVTYSANQKRSIPLRAVRPQRPRPLPKRRHY